MEKYQYLKEEYLKYHNKADAIKSGMNHFGMPMKEAKEIVDTIADEIYEEEKNREKEQVLLNQDQSFNEQYKFSLIVYFWHKLLYQLIIGFFLTKSIFVCKDYGITVEYPIIVFAWCILELVYILHVLTDLATHSTISFSVEPGRMEYSYKKPRFDKSQKYHKRNRRFYLDYEIQTIERVEEYFNSFVIYGTIIKGKSTNRRATDYGKTDSCRLKKIKVPKYFHNNKKLIETLKK